jgi:hypothetical protein
MKRKPVSINIEKTVLVKNPSVFLMDGVDTPVSRYVAFVEVDKTR